MRLWRPGVLVSFLTAWVAVGTPICAQPDDLAALNREVKQLYQAGKHAEALPIAHRALEVAERRFGREHPAVGNALNELALLHKSRGQYGEAEPLYQRNIAILEKARGADHAELSPPLNNLAELYRAQGRYAEGEPLLKRAIANLERSLGRERLEVAYPINNLGQLYEDQGREAEAEPLYKRSLELREKHLAPDHAAIAVTLNNLSALYRKQHRFAEAEPLQIRALTIREKSLGPDHPLVGQSVGNLALIYATQGRDAEAEPLYKRGHAIIEKAMGPNHRDVIVSLSNHANFLRFRRRAAEAEPLMRRAMDIAEQTLGPDHPLLGTTLHSLALLSADMGRRANVEPLMQRALAVLEKTLGADHPDLVRLLSNLGTHYYFQGDWERALGTLTRGANIAMRRSRQGQQGGFESHAGQSGEAARASFAFPNLARVHYRLAEQTPARAPEQLRAAFVAAQWARGSDAAASLAQMAVREAKGDTALARIVRERQDLVGEWQARDKLLIAAVSQPPERRSSPGEAAERARLTAIDARLRDIDRTLAADFPEYAALTNPEPLSIAETQAQLGAGEALVLFLEAPAAGAVPEAGFVWAVTRTDARWARIERGQNWLATRVQALRCGLDRAAWSGDGAARCATLLSRSYTDADINTGRLPPFDLARAHELYSVLFGKVEDLIKDKHLLLVPSGPLTALPFQVLVTDRPAADIPRDARGYASAAWLSKRHALTVLPSVTSLRALRQFAKSSKATQPYIGFGNPLLLGPDGSDRRAWERQDCKAPPAPVQIASRAMRGAIPRYFRRGLADVDEVRAQHPLPETADELCAVAQSSGAAAGAVYLGGTASETIIKALSVDGTLAQARVVHFATHGLLAGETEMLAASKAEPALLLTPPMVATEQDDGLLTASELTQIRLDADWVVLSACNTAAADSEKPGAEALSGLARAFFYAGARALLVSHWAVNSEATVKLITKAFDELKADPKIGRAEGLRRSMLAMTETGDGYAHPANWAPFVVVGEGGTAR